MSIKNAVLIFVGRCTLDTYPLKVRLFGQAKKSLDRLKKNFLKRKQKQVKTSIYPDKIYLKELKNNSLRHTLKDDIYSRF